MTSTVQPDFGHTETRNVAKATAVPVRKGKRWTPAERLEWVAFWRGDTDTPPSDRDARSIREHVSEAHAPFKSVTKEQQHAAWCAVRPLIERVPYTGSGCHLEFVESVMRAAVRVDGHCPENIPLHCPEPVFLTALQRVRKALRS